MAPTHTVQDLSVALGQRSYPISFHRDSAQTAERLAQHVSGYSKVAVVADAGLAEFAGELAAQGYAVRVFPARGETLKSFAELESLHGWFAEVGLDRKGCVVALGGGVVGDLAGFAAATWLRGVDFVQVPTTLLAMVDSSVGGKTGINTQAGKNLVGAFYQPQAVLVNTGFLGTLPKREFSAGMAEVIKYGLLADAALFEQLEQGEPLSPEHPQLAQVVRRCCELKAEVVRADEREQAASGGRALLNLGHTFAHAVENVAGYGEYLHGEAVGVGLVLAAELSLELGRVEAAVVERTRALCEKYALPVALRKPLAVDKLMAAMFLDKKTTHGKLRFVVMDAIGQAVTLDGVEEPLVRTLWEKYGAL